MSTHTRPKGKSPADSKTVYLIHFRKPYRHARHYLGFTENLDKRITDHLCGMGARLMEVVTNAGIEWLLARTWQGDRKLERRLKGWHNAKLLCPMCCGGEALSRGNFPQKIQRFVKHTR
jgi:predicted GIY-YIG superfamily endonuclease